MSEMASHARTAATSALRTTRTSARSCSRTSCRAPATASLSFRYATSQVWLLDLAVSADPSLYDLCPEHADALTVPRGWERVDQRTEPPVPEPKHVAVADDAAAGPSSARPAGATAEGRHAPHPPDHRPSRPPNRYAALSADLPLLAAQVAGATSDADPTVPADEPGGAAAREADARAARPRDARHRAAVASGHDGSRPQAPRPQALGSGAAGAGATPQEDAAPPPAVHRAPSADAARSDVTAGAPGPGPSSAPGPVASSREASNVVDPTPALGGPHGEPDGEAAGPPPEVDGQLALGVEPFTGALAVDAEPVGGVVVPIGAGARRRQDRGSDSGRTASPPGSPSTPPPSRVD